MVLQATPEAIFDRGLFKDQAISKVLLEKYDPYYVNPALSIIYYVLMAIEIIIIVAFWHLARSGAIDKFLSRGYLFPQLTIGLFDDGEIIVNDEDNSAMESLPSINMEVKEKTADKSNRDSYHGAAPGVDEILAATNIVNHFNLSMYILLIWVPESPKQKDAVARSTPGKSTQSSGANDSNPTKSDMKQVDAVKSS